MTWTIQAITDELAGQQILIQHDMLVGRHQSADLILQSAEISRKHAVFLLKDEVLSVQDLGSSNGTFVNDQRISTETILNNGDIVQFASLKFSVLSTVAKQQLEAVVEQVTAPLQSGEPASAERIAQADHQDQVTVSEQTHPAQHMNDQGMPELKERDHSVQLNRDGMPQTVAIPKPAPIPEGTDLHTTTPAQPASSEPAVNHAAQQKEVQKNASIGLISLIVLIIVAIVAWLLFKS